MFGSLPKLRIVYFSSQPSALTNMIVGGFQQSGAEILLVVTTPGTSTRQTEAYKDVVANKLPGVDILVTSHIRRLAPMLRELKPDLIFVTGFPWRLPAELLSIPRLGSINTHPAPLPRYRGPNPIYWQVVNGEPEIGMTVHRMENEFDTGPILAQATMPIDPEWYIEDVVQNLTQIGPQVIARGFAAAVAGEPGTPQPSEGASYAPLSTEDDRKLDWNRTAAQLRNQVRAWGQKGAIGEIGGQEWIVRRARVVENKGDSAKIGSVVDIGPAKRAVQTGEGLLLLEEAEMLPGGE